MTRCPKALVVEDNAADVNYVSAVLNSVGHKFEVAGSQAEATALLAKHDYDYTLLDREIPYEPGGIKRLQNGDNLFEQIKRDPRLNGMRVIIITAYDVSDPDQAVEMVKQGAFDFIAKPFNPGRRKTLDKVVQRAASGLAAFHPAWQMTTLMDFIENYCQLRPGESAKARKNAVMDAAKHERIRLPAPAVPRARGQSAVYFTKDLVLAWQDYRQKGIDLPPLRSEISGLF